MKLTSVVGRPEAARLRFDGELDLEGGFAADDTGESSPLRWGQGGDGRVVFGLDVLGRVEDLRNSRTAAAPTI